MKTLKQLLKNFGGWKSHARNTGKLQTCLIPIIKSEISNSNNSLKSDLVNLVHSLFVELWNVAKYICFAKSHGVLGYYNEYQALEGWICKLISAIILINPIQMGFLMYVKQMGWGKTTPSGLFLIRLSYQTYFCYITSLSYAV